VDRRRRLARHRDAGGVACLGEDLYRKRLAHRSQEFVKAVLRSLLADKRAGSW